MSIRMLWCMRMVARVTQCLGILVRSDCVVVYLKLIFSLQVSAAVKLGVRTVFGHMRLGVVRRRDYAVGDLCPVSSGAAPGGRPRNQRVIRIGNCPSIGSRTINLGNS